MTTLLKLAARVAFAAAPVLLNHYRNHRGEPAMATTTAARSSPPRRSLGRRALRALLALLTIAFLLAAAFTAGELMQASHTRPDTQALVGLVAAVCVVFLGMTTFSRSTR